MFERLSEKLRGVMRSIRGLNHINENNIKEALAQVRDALLDADVSFEVLKSFLENIRQKSLGERVTKSIDPGQQLIKIIHDSLVELFNHEQEFSNEKPLRVLMVGLHGSGKTTSTVKLANYLKNKGYTPLVVACDVNRPAAIDQLEQLAQKDAIAFHGDRNQKDPIAIARKGLLFGEERGCDAIIFDTAGRLQMGDALAKELTEMRKAINPQEVLLVADSALGQESVSVAKAFHEAVNLSGIFLTKLDGDARGGAALSMKYATGVAIQFIGVGENSGDMDVFRADGMAQRILGMGDVVALVERAKERVNRDEADRLARRFKKAEFDFEDYLSQIEQIGKMGSMSSLVKLLPGMANAQISERELSQIQQTKAMIQSMTIQERRKPSLIVGNRKLRIAKGSGTQIRHVNHLLKHLEMMKASMKKYKGKDGNNMTQKMQGAQAVQQLSKLFGDKD
ncbi:MAG: signal recognition particle protein [Puniceicoccales bacterium]|jgi:signal recognition particle subunit SRP54|nr:signal recognition particle protein [Puniceicoccales bacterium]